MWDGPTYLACKHKTRVHLDAFNSMRAPVPLSTNTPPLAHSSLLAACEEGEYWNGQATCLTCPGTGSTSAAQSPDITACSKYLPLGPYSQPLHIELFWDCPLVGIVAWRVAALSRMRTSDAGVRATARTAGCDARVLVVVAPWDSLSSGVVSDQLLLLLLLLLLLPLPQAVGLDRCTRPTRPQLSPLVVSRLCVLHPDTHPTWHPARTRQ
jgi:hypothetical protein